MFSYLLLGDAIKRVGGTQIGPSPLHVLPSMFLSGLQLRERLVVCVRSTLLVLIWCYEYVYNPRELFCWLDLWIYQTVART